MIKIIICSDGLHDTSRIRAVCHIICAGGYSGSFVGLRAGDYVIAVDGGLRYLEELKISPDLIIGDFDSLGYVPDAENIVELNAEKDDTDTMAAVRAGFDMGFSVFYIHFGMGGRLDHTIANIQTLAFIQQNGGFGMLFGVKEGAVLVDKSIGFSEQMKGYISVFSYASEASGVFLEGLKYGLEDGVLANSFPVGCSNEFVGQKSRISVKRGTLLIIFQFC